MARLKREPGASAHARELAMGIGRLVVFRPANLGEVPGADGWIGGSSS